MQTEAAPREPFTLGALLRYKLTIFIVAFLVAFGGYARIITQPPRYEATARLAVRFTSEALALQEVERGSFFRLPLLEEEVKAYMVQITDPKFIDDVLQNLPPDVQGEATSEVPPTPEPTAVQKLQKQFLKAYYDIRGRVLTFLDTVLLIRDTTLSEREQEVMKVLARLDVSTGTEASHIIKISFQNLSPVFAAKIANAIARRFIDTQKRQVSRQDVEKHQKEVERLREEVVKVKLGLYRLEQKLGSPTLADALKDRTLQLRSMKEERGRLEVVGNLLAQKIFAYDSKVSVGSHFVVGELERQFLDILVRYDAEMQRVTEQPEFYRGLIKNATKILEDRRAVVLGRYRKTVEARRAFVEEEIKRLESDTTYEDVAPEYSRLEALQDQAQVRLQEAERDLQAAREFNKQLEDQNVSQNVKVWQPAQVPPFPVPQHRGLKLMVVIVLGFLAGCGAALLRHQIRPKRARRARPRREEEKSAPLFLVSDDANKEQPRAPRIDISFPAQEGTRPPPDDVPPQ